MRLAPRLVATRRAAARVVDLSPATVFPDAESPARFSSSKDPPGAAAAPVVVARCGRVGAVLQRAAEVSPLAAALQGRREEHLKLTRAAFAAADPRGPSPFQLVLGGRCGDFDAGGEAAPKDAAAFAGAGPRRNARNAERDRRLERHQGPLQDGGGAGVIALWLPARALAVPGLGIRFLGAVEALLVTDAARRLVRGVRSRVQKDVDAAVGYSTLAKFLLSTLLLVLVLFAQRGFGAARGRARLRNGVLGPERRSMYRAIYGQLFGESAAVLRDGVSDIAPTIASADAFVDWVEEQILSPIFAAEVCGDGTCQFPDEQPDFAAAAGARTFSESCAADCGTARTKLVKIDFFDVAKLFYASRHMQAALDSGWRGLSAARWGIEDVSEAKPVAGWNMCAVGRRRHGAFEDVCLLDGDVFIDGRPYRTAELDVDDALFGGEYTFDGGLFEADWELRIAYDHFEWEAIDGLGAPPKAFPAVRGRVCQETGLDASNETLYGLCEVWAPCSGADECSCEFYDSEHVCYAVHSTALENAPLLAFARSNALIWLADWWHLGNNLTAISFEDLDESHKFTDDMWNVFDAATDVYRLVLTDASYPYTGWTASLQITDVDAGTDVLAGGGLRATGTQSEVDIYLDAGADYYINVGADCVSSQVVWSLEDSSGTVIRSGGACVEDCAVFKDEGDAVACTATVCDVPPECSRRLADDDAAPPPSDDAAPSDDGTDDAAPFVDDDAAPPFAGAPTASPTLRRPTLRPTRSPSPEPSSTFVPTTFVPSLSPTSISNAFAADVRSIAADDIFVDAAAGCLVAALGDAVCDEPNNNAGCGFDGGDCCVDTCRDEDASCPLNADGDATDDDSCVSPARIGSVSTESSQACDMNYAVDPPSEDPPFRRLGLEDDPELLTASDCVPRWPYFVEDDSEADFDGDAGWHLKFPFEAQRAYRDVRTIRLGYESTLEDLPSLYCPDCAHPDASAEGQAYSAFSFTVNTSGIDWRTAHAEAFPLFEASDSAPERARYLTEPNLVLIGPKMTTTRYATKKCTADSALFDDDGGSRCMKDSKPWSRGRTVRPNLDRDEFKRERYDDSPYGTDAAFMTDSAVYRASNAISDFYESSEINGNGLPFGFFSDQGIGGLAHFPVVFDTRLNRTRFQEQLTSMNEGGFLDQQTRRVSLSLPLFNEESGLVALVTVGAVAEDAGGYEFQWAIEVVDLRLYETNSDWLRFLGELAFVAAQAFLLVFELCRNPRRRWGNPLGKPEASQTD